MPTPTKFVLTSCWIFAMLAATTCIRAQELEGDEPVQKSWWDETPWQHPERGFHWYPDPPKKKKEAVPKPTPAPVSATVMAPTTVPQVKPAPAQQVLITGKAKDVPENKSNSRVEIVLTSKKADASPLKEANSRDKEAELNLDKDVRVVTEIKELRAIVEGRMNRAVMNPTPANLKSYLDANKFMLDRGAAFADMWQRTVWQSPDLDYNGVSPSANAALYEARQQDDVNRQNAVKELAGRYGLMFFYRSDCQFCHMQAPIMLMAREKFGIDVIAVSLDGGAIPGFPDARIDNGISRNITQGEGISVTPTIFLIDRATMKGTMLGSGYLALDELVQRVITIHIQKPLIERQQAQNFKGNNYGQVYAR